MVEGIQTVGGELGLLTGELCIRENSPEIWDEVKIKPWQVFPRLFALLEQGTGNITKPTAGASQSRKVGECLVGLVLLRPD